MEDMAIVCKKDESIARKFLDFFPGDNADNLRHSVKAHRKHKPLDGGKGQKAFVRAEAKHIATMEELGRASISICMKNATDIREIFAEKRRKAKESVDTIDLLRSSQSMAPAMGLLAKLIQPDKPQEQITNVNINLSGLTEAEKDELERLVAKAEGHPEGESAGKPA